MIATRPGARRSALGHQCAQVVLLELEELHCRERAYRGEQPSRELQDKTGGSFLAAALLLGLLPSAGSAPAGLIR